MNLTFYEPFFLACLFTLLGFLIPIQARHVLKGVCSLHK